MSKFDKRKLWACVVAGLLGIVAVCAIDVVLIMDDVRGMLREGVEVEYVSDSAEGE